MVAINRRHFLSLSALLGVSAAASANTKHKKLLKTPDEIEGPFYPVVAQADKDFDLTQLNGQQGTAEGEVVHIAGKVTDTEGKAIVGAMVDIWQANTHGRYSHPQDPNDAPLDENFQGWAIVRSGSGGEFKFKTIVPGAYPATRNWMRPPHIHFKVAKRGYLEVTTQMYFPDQQLNDVDRLLQSKSAEEQAVMIAAQIGTKEDGQKLLSYHIVLEQA